MNEDEYALKLSILTNVSCDFIFKITTITVFSSKDLYDFYGMMGRFPTINEMYAAFELGPNNFYTAMKLINKMKTN